MKKFEIEDLKKLLQEAYGRTINLKLEGIISTTICVNFAQIDITPNEMIIKNKQNDKEKVKLNRYQIIKIEKEEKSLMIEFDNLQIVKISIL